MNNINNIINKIKIKNYIKIILLKKKILKKFNISYNEKILNNLLSYYPTLKYNITKNYITISDDKSKNINIKFNKCNNLVNKPCKNGKNKYKIIIGFNTKSKIYLPVDLLTLECDNDNKLMDYTKKIKDILKNDKYLKNIISYVIYIKNNNLS